MEPNRFYFTFRQTDRDRTGKRLKGFYVEVVAENMQDAKEKFFAKFAKTDLPHPLMWDSVHTETIFQKNFYPNGLLKTIQ